VKTLAELVLGPDNPINEIHYYTARVTGRNGGDQPRNQQIYLKALKTIPGLELHFGSFLSKKKWMRLVHPPKFGDHYVQVRDTEEKGSDVNLATHLIHHAWQDRFDVAAVISGDTDLVEPIRIVAQEKKRAVGILSPRERCPEKLTQAATFVRFIRKQHLSAAQFPDRLPKKASSSLQVGSCLV